MGVSGRERAAPQRAPTSLWKETSHSVRNPTALATDRDGNHPPPGGGMRPRPEHIYIIYVSGSTLSIKTLQEKLVGAQLHVQRVETMGSKK